VVFARRAAQVWTVKVDPAENSYQQTLKKTGTRAPNSVLSFGDLDTFYLDDSGIRSIKARNGTNAGFVSDVGTAVDPYVRDILKNLSDAVIAKATACLEPIDGRYMLALGNNRVMVFSYFPSAKITGWTSYTLDFTPELFVDLNNQIYVRAGTTLYLYGGDNGDTYDSCAVSAALQFIDGGKPGTFKSVSGIDLIGVGAWAATAAVDPRDDTLFVDYGKLTGITVGDGPSAGCVTTAFVAPVFTHQAEGPASISKVLVLYEPGDEEA